MSDVDSLQEDTFRPVCNVRVDNCDEDGAISMGTTKPYPLRRRARIWGLCNWQERFQFVCNDESAMIRERLERVFVETSDLATKSADSNVVTLGMLDPIAVSDFKTVDSEPMTYALKFAARGEDRGGEIDIAVRWYYDSECADLKATKVVEGEPLEASERENISMNEDLLRDKDDLNAAENEAEERKLASAWRRSKTWK